MSSHSALEASLQAAGIRCRVEGRDRLALLSPLESGLHVDESARLRLHALALSAGFTHSALELTDEYLSGAALPGDQPA